MKPQTLWHILNLVLTMLAALAWAAVIWVALQVSAVVLNTLQAIVDLAQLS